MRALLLALAISTLPLSAFALALPPLPPPPVPGTASYPGTANYQGGASVAGSGQRAGASMVVREEAVRRVIEEFLVQRAAPLKAQVSVKKIGYSGDLRLPPGEVSYEIVVPERWEGYGSVSLALVVRVNGEVKKNQTVLVEVEALAEMVVATRTLERGEVLTAADLSLARRDLAHVQGRFLKSIDDAVGLRVKNTVRPNMALRSDGIERVPVIKSGQIVTIVAENEVVKITATGKAKGAGAIGDQIMVQNTNSQKDLPAWVIDASTVKVDF